MTVRRRTRALRCCARVSACLAVTFVLGACERAAPASAEGAVQAVGTSQQAIAPARFEEDFEAAYLRGWRDDAAAATGPLRRSADVRDRTAADFLRDYRPLEIATTGELRMMVRSGDAFRDTEAAIAELGLDADELVDVLAVHHAVHWAVVNRDRVRREQLPAIRGAIASSPQFAQLQASDDAARQAYADRAALLTAIRSREYVSLLRAGNATDLQRYADRVAADFEQRYGIDLREGGIDRASTPARSAARNR